MVACSDNIFFDISNQDFTIIPLADAGGPYVTDEGVDVTLDGTGSSSLVFYEWDFNNDGFYDLAVLNSTPFTLWTNNGGSNNWLKIDLEGTSSNRDGTGSRIVIWREGNRYSADSATAWRPLPIGSWFIVASKMFVECRVVSNYRCILGKRANFIRHSAGERYLIGCVDVGCSTRSSVWE